MIVGILVGIAAAEVAVIVTMKSMMIIASIVLFGFTEAVSMGRVFGRSVSRVMEIR